MMAVTINDWCIDLATGVLDMERGTSDVAGLSFSATIYR